MVHQVRLKPALRLFEMSPAGVSLTEPVTLNGPPNSFCSALSVPQRSGWAHHDRLTNA